MRIFPRNNLVPITRRRDKKLVTIKHQLIIFDILTKANVRLFESRKNISNNCIIHLKSHFFHVAF